MKKNYDKPFTLFSVKRSKDEKNSFLKETLMDVNVKKEFVGLQYINALLQISNK